MCSLTKKAGETHNNKRNSIDLYKDQDIQWTYLLLTG